MAKKKVVIVMVEGISDEQALSSLKKYFKDVLGIYIYFTSGDIFSNNKNRKGIKATVGDHLEKVMNVTKFTKEDILAVIQITDTDGTFINDDAIIIDNSITDKKYLDECIAVPDQQTAVNIKQRNKIKALNVKTMYKTNKVKKSIYYYLLYFSCNLDHVIHNERNLNDSEKAPKAKEFDKRFKGKPNDFLDFFKNGDFAVDSTYEDTWEFIQQGHNSLGKYSNFRLLFDIVDSLITGTKM